MKNPTPQVVRAMLINNCLFIWTKLVLIPEENLFSLFNEKLIKFKPA